MKLLLHNAIAHNDAPDEIRKQAKVCKHEQNAECVERCCVDGAAQTRQHFQLRINQNVSMSSKHIN